MENLKVKEKMWKSVYLCRSCDIKS